MKKKFILVPIILLLLTLLLSMPCDKYLSCRGSLSDTLAYPGQWFFLIIVLSLFALTLNEQKHKVWLIMTGIFFTVGMFFTYATPEYGSGIISIDRELTNWFFVGLYSFVSVIYFITQFVKRRGDKLPQ